MTTPDTDAAIDEQIRLATHYYAEEPDGEIGKLLRAIWAASRLAALEEAAKVCEELAFDSELALAMVNDDGSPFFNKKDVELGIAACNNCAADIRELIKR